MFSDSFSQVRRVTYIPFALCILEDIYIEHNQKLKLYYGVSVAILQRTGLSKHHGYLLILEY